MGGCAASVLPDGCFFFADTGLDLWSSCIRGRPIHRADLRRRWQWAGSSPQKTYSTRRRAMFDFCCLLYFKPPPRPVARSLQGSCALVGEGAYNNAGQQKSHLARQSVLFFPPNRSWVWLGCEEGILCVDVSLGRFPVFFLRLAACRSHLAR